MIFDLRLTPGRMLFQIKINLRSLSGSGDFFSATGRGFTQQATTWQASSRDLNAQNLDLLTK